MSSRPVRKWVKKQIDKAVADVTDNGFSIRTKVQAALYEERQQISTLIKSEGATSESDECKAFAQQLVVKVMGRV